MATTARKARKRAGIQFTKASKVGTPPEERAIPVVQDRAGRVTGAVITHTSKRYLGKLVKRFGADVFEDKTSVS